MKTETENIWNSANVYAELAIERLSFVNWRNEDELDAAHSELIIHFLFPNLVESDRAFLLALWKMRRGLSLGLNTPGKDPAFESQCVELEAEFSTLKSEVCERLFPTLTESQIEIIEEQFMRISFRE